MPFVIGLGGGEGVVSFEGDFGADERYSYWEVASCEEAEVASDKINRTALFVVLVESVLICTVFGNFALCRFI